MAPTIYLVPLFLERPCFGRLLLQTVMTQVAEVTHLPLARLGYLGQRLLYPRAVVQHLILWAFYLQAQLLVLPLRVLGWRILCLTLNVLIPRNYQVERSPAPLLSVESVTHFPQLGKPYRVLMSFAL